MAQGVGPEFKLQCTKKRKTTTKKKTPRKSTNDYLNFKNRHL
jgi:hypothetical protein